MIEDSDLVELRSESVNPNVSGDSVDVREMPDCLFAFDRRLGAGRDGR